MGVGSKQVASGNGCEGSCGLIVRNASHSADFQAI